MLLAIDVHYVGNKAKAAGLLFNFWDDDHAAGEVTARLDDIEAYEPGKFYKRELPCIMKLLENIDLNTIEAIVIDGYVYLNDNHDPGLGALLWERLKRQVPVIGVAKTSFYGNKQTVTQVLRGQSSNPLYISAVGTDVKKAADFIKNMKGKYRMPDLLKMVDHKTKHD